MQAFATLTLAVGSILGSSAAAWAGEGQAHRASKVVTCAIDESGRATADSVVADGVVLVKDGRIEAVLAADAEVPAGYALVDHGDAWLVPGLIDLHTHVAGGGFNDAVFQANPGLRSKCTVVPDNRSLQRAVAGGVTTHLFIPGSATNVGGQGVLVKTAGQRYEDMLVRDPGSLKVAQADNPKRWGYRMNRIMLNWTIREIFQRGTDYAKAWAAFEAGAGPEPARDIQLDVFRDLLARRTQISAHTQVHQVVLASIKIMADEFGLDLYIDHGTFDGYLATEEALKHDVPAIIGPRTYNDQNKGRGIDTDGAFIGVAGEYQKRGMVRVGFNTDAPVVPAEELSLQAALGVRFGFEDANMEALLGLTIVPAGVAGIAHRVGSLEPGKDADLVVVDGHPADPRSQVLEVYVEGELAYDAAGGQLY